MCWVLQRHMKALGKKERNVTEREGFACARKWSFFKVFDERLVCK